MVSLRAVEPGHAAGSARRPDPARPPRLRPGRRRARSVPRPARPTAARPRSRRRGCRSRGPRACDHAGRPRRGTDPGRRRRHRPRRSARLVEAQEPILMWLAVLVGATGCYLCKLAGLSVPQRVLDDPRTQRIAALLPIALLAALAATQTFIP